MEWHCAYCNANNVLCCIFPWIQIFVPLDLFVSLGEGKVEVWMYRTVEDALYVSFVGRRLQFNLEPPSSIHLAIRCVGGPSFVLGFFLLASPG
jgi:hypothetical protein